LSARRIVHRFFYDFIRFADRQGRAALGTRRFGGIALGIVVLIAGSAPAAADYLEPHSIAECDMNRAAYGYRQRLEDISREGKQCSNDNPNEGRWVASCNDMGPRVCLPIFRKACVVMDEMKSRREQCIARYDAQRAQEVAEKKRKEQEEKAAKAAALASQVPPGSAAMAHGIVGATGGGQLLSDAIVNGALPALGEIRKDALNTLAGRMNSFGPDASGNARSFSPSYPRRSNAQKNRVFNLMDEARRAEQSNSRLPFEQSIVSGAYGSMLTEIVRAHAAGEISSPFAAIGMALATWVAWEAGQAELLVQQERLTRKRQLVRRQQAAVMAAKQGIVQKERAHRQLMERLERESREAQRKRDEARQRERQAQLERDRRDREIERRRQEAEARRRDGSGVSTSGRTSVPSDFDNARRQLEQDRRNNCGQRTCGIF